MKSRLLACAVCMLTLSSCETPAPQDGSSYYYASSNAAASAPASTTTASRGSSVPRGGYAPGSGPTAMPQGNQFMYQQNETGLFGTRSSSTVIQSSGGVQSYQTIGGVPVYPGAGIPGYVPNQPYMGAPMPQQPLNAPGMGVNPGYYLDPRTGAWVRR